MDKQEAYRIVYEDLHGVPLLRGEDIDTRQADYWWLRGMREVVERVAAGVSTETKKAFQEEYKRNFEASIQKYEGREEPIFDSSKEDDAPCRIDDCGPIGSDVKF